MFDSQIVWKRVVIVSLRLIYLKDVILDVKSNFSCRKNVSSRIRSVVCEKRIWSIKYQGLRSSYLVHVDKKKTFIVIVDTSAGEGERIW